MHELTEDKVEIGRVLGVAHRVGSDLCYWILTVTGRVITRNMVQRVTREDQALPSVKTKMENFDTMIKEKLDDHCHKEEVPANGLTLDDEDLNDEPESKPKMEQDDYTDKAYDAYVDTPRNLEMGSSQ